MLGQEYENWYSEMRKAEEDGKDFTVSEPTPNFRMRGEQWERPANFEVIDRDATVLNQCVGIRIQGNSSRNEILKRFSVYSRPIYSGSNFFSERVFSDHDSHSVILRPGKYNAISSELITGRSCIAPPIREAVVFLNGEYWYSAFIQEKFSTAFFSSKYGLLQDNIEIIDLSVWSRLGAKEQKQYQAILDFAESLDLSKNDDYQTFQKSVDIQSYKIGRAHV